MRFSQRLKAIADLRSGSLAELGPPPSLADMNVQWSGIELELKKITKTQRPARENV
jgi:hypothetical protein